MNRGFKKISLEQWKKDYQDKDAEIIYETIKLPKRATQHSAGYDIFSPFNITIYPNHAVKIATGIKIYMKDNEYVSIVPRSSMGFNYFMRLANTMAVGDSDYYDNPSNEGHYWIKVRNEGEDPMTIKAGEAFAQAIFHEFLIADDDIEHVIGNQRTGGLGSTG